MVNGPIIVKCTLYCVNCSSENISKQIMFVFFLYVDNEKAMRNRAQSSWPTCLFTLVSYYCQIGLINESRYLIHLATLSSHHSSTKWHKIPQINSTVELLLIQIREREVKISRLGHQCIFISLWKECMKCLISGNEKRIKRFCQTFRLENKVKLSSGLSSSSRYSGSRCADLLTSKLRTLQNTIWLKLNKTLIMQYTCALLS